MSESGDVTGVPDPGSATVGGQPVGAAQEPLGFAPGEPVYHLHLEPDEARLAASALRLLISDEAHEPLIRRIAREALAATEREPASGEPLVVPLSPPGMKITHTAVKLLLDDLRRDQAAEQRILRQILDKLPDEHAIRAITLE